MGLDRDFVRTDDGIASERCPPCPDHLSLYLATCQKGNKGCAIVRRSAKGKATALATPLRNLLVASIVSNGDRKVPKSSHKTSVLAALQSPLRTLPTVTETFFVQVR